MSVEQLRDHLPDFLSATRPVLSLAALGAYLDGEKEKAFSWWAAATATDVLDGPLARFLGVADGQQGRMVDKVADTALVGTLASAYASERPLRSLVVMGVFSWFARWHIQHHGDLQAALGSEPFAEKSNGRVDQTERALFYVCLGVTLLDLFRAQKKPLAAFLPAAVIGGLSLLGRVGLEKAARSRRA